MVALEIRELDWVKKGGSYALALEYNNNPHHRPAKFQGSSMVLLALHLDAVK